MKSIYDEEANNDMTESIENRIYRLENEMVDLKVGQAKIFEIASQSNKIHESLQDTLERLNGAVASIEKSMVMMQNEIKTNTISIAAINDEIACMKVTVKNTDDKSKIDMAVIIKEWGTKLILAALAGAGLMALIEKIISSLK